METNGFFGEKPRASGVRVRQVSRIIKKWGEFMNSSRERITSVDGKLSYKYEPANLKSVPKERAREELKPEAQDSEAYYGDDYYHPSTSNERSRLAPPLLATLWSFGILLIIFTIIGSMAALLTSLGSQN